MYNFSELFLKINSSSNLVLKKYVTLPKLNLSKSFLPVLSGYWPAFQAFRDSEVKNGELKVMRKGHNWIFS